MRQPHPRISVVVPSYNQANYLRENLESLLNQDYPNLEVLVLDGGSTDGSVEVIKEFGDQLAFWRSAPDGGQAAAIKEGFERSTGEVLGWLNSDDIMNPGGVRQVAEAFSDNPKARWITGNSHIIDGSSRLMALRMTASVDIIDLVNLHYYLPQESTYFTRDLYSEVGGIDTSLHYALDYDLWLKFARVVPPTHVEAFIGKFRYLPSQKSAETEKYLAEENRIKRGYADFQRSALVRASRWVRLKALLVVKRRQAEGFLGPIRQQWRQLRGEGPQLGFSRKAAVVMFASMGMIALALLMALIGAVRWLIELAAQS